MISLPAWISEYVGIPFVNGGRDRSGADCYGLVSMILEDQTGAPLPQTPDEARVEGWYNIPINQIQSGDVVLFKHPNDLTHVALMITSDHYIDTRPGTTSSIRRKVNFSGKATVWRRNE